MKFVNQVLCRCNVCKTEWHMNAHDIVGKIKPICPRCGLRHVQTIGNWEFRPFPED